MLYTYVVAHDSSCEHRCFGAILSHVMLSFHISLQKWNVTKEMLNYVLWGSQACKVAAEQLLDEFQKRLKTWQSRWTWFDRQKYTVAGIILCLSVLKGLIVTMGWCNICSSLVNVTKLHPCESTCKCGCMRRVFSDKTWKFERGRNSLVFFNLYLKRRWNILCPAQNKT